MRKKRDQVQQLKEASLSSSLKKYEVPLTMTKTGDASELVKRFIDKLRTRAAAQYPFKANITIIGDPRLEPTIINTNTTIKIVYRNKFGDSHPLYSGVYYVKDIKHQIDAGNYKTLMELLKVPTSHVGNQQLRNEEQERTRELHKGEPVKIALLTAYIQQKGNGFTCVKISPWVEKTYTNSKRVGTLLGNNEAIIKTLESAISNAIKNASTFERAGQILNKKWAKKMATLQQTVDGKKTKQKRPVNFIVYSVKA